MRSPRSRASSCAARARRAIDRATSRGVDRRVASSSFRMSEPTVDPLARDESAPAIAAPRSKKIKKVPNVYMARNRASCENDLLFDARPRPRVARRRHVSAVATRRRRHRARAIARARTPRDARRRARARTRANPSIATRSRGGATRGRGDATRARPREANGRANGTRRRAAAARRRATTARARRESASARERTRVEVRGRATAAIRRRGDDGARAMRARATR